jgi:tetrapyrrole methylase family protein/MazG family protein
MAITIVGLGPGDPALLTRQAWDTLSDSDEVFLRTGQHPTVAGLPDGLVIHAFDSMYEQSGGFADVYAAITARVLALGRRKRGVIYAVPGHPLVGEATVTALLQQAAAERLPVKIVAGLSFIGPVLAALQIDGMDGLQVADALEVALCLHPALNPDAPAMLGQLYCREVAGDVKLTLMNQYPDQHLVHLVHAASTAEEQVDTVPLHALDHCQSIGHLTTLYVPPLPQRSGFEGFQETIARLRGPGGCPWDQEQTHQSLGPGLLEETAEVMDALDANDMDALCEELGDLLLHIVLQAQIATEDGDFTAADVIAGIEAKIRRRHPHVFGRATASTVEQVCANWDAIKRRERGSQEERSALDGVPASLPALARAAALLGKAASSGFDFPGGDEAVARVGEKVAVLLAADTREEQMKDMGDLLFAAANWARSLDLDAESALRSAIWRFRQRFLAFEAAARDRAGGISNLDADEVQSLWQASRPELRA